MSVYDPNNNQNKISQVVLIEFVGVYVVGLSAELNKKCYETVHSSSANFPRLLYVCLVQRDCDGNYEFY
jgi:hypothetical protein